MMRARGEVVKPGKEEPEGPNFFPKKFGISICLCKILLSLSIVKVKLVLAFLFSKRKHVTRAGVPKHVMQS